MRLPWLITTLLVLGVPRGAIMLAVRGNPVLQRAVAQF